MTDPTDRRAYLARLPILEEVADTGRAVLFARHGPDGQRAILEVCGPFWVQVGCEYDAAPVLPYLFTVWQGTKAAPTGFYTFGLYPDTVQGAQVLTKASAYTVKG